MNAEARGAARRREMFRRGLQLALLAGQAQCGAQQTGCPAHTHATASGGCQCDPGYRVNSAGTACEPGALGCPAHAHATAAGSAGLCQCDAGFQVDAAGSACVSGVTVDSGCPAHAHAATSGGGCECDLDSHVNDAGTACVLGVPSACPSGEGRHMRLRRRLPPERGRGCLRDAMRGHNRIG